MSAVSISQAGRAQRSNVIKSTAIHFETKSAIKARIAPDGLEGEGAGGWGGGQGGREKNKNKTSAYGLGGEPPTPRLHPQPAKPITWIPYVPASLIKANDRV